MFGTKQTQTSQGTIKRPRGIRLITFGIALVGVVAMQLATAAPAAGFSYRTLSGQPGGVAVVPQVVADGAPAGCVQIWMGSYFICVPVKSKALGHATDMVINHRAPRAGPSTSACSTESGP